MLSVRKIWCYSILTALTVRGVFAYLVSLSMFRNYHLVRGLDMQTLLRFSEWGSGQSDAIPFFLPHRIMIFTQWYFNGGIHNVWIVFLIQSVIGALGCAAAADLFLHLTGRRRGALWTGVTCAFYLPALVCEFSVLQDSFALNLTLFAFWSSVRTTVKRFAPGWTVVCALLWSLALAGRPTAVLLAAATFLWSFRRMYRLKKCRRFGFFVLILLVLLGIYSTFNFAHNWNFSPFYSVMRYAREYNAAPDGSAASPAGVLVKAVTRLPQLFSAWDMPENQNIYFWCEKIPLLHLFIAPGLLLPSACAGMVMLLIGGIWKTPRYALILLPVAALALPLCAREVIGRYRLMLTPYLVMAAVMGYYLLKSADVRKKTVYLLAGSIAMAAAVYAGIGKKHLRSEDFHAWALALENTPGTGKLQVLDAFGDYFQATGGRSGKAFCAVIDRALFFRELEYASGIIAQAYQNGISPDLVGYYHGWIYVLKNDPRMVEKVYSRIDPEKLPGDLKKNYLRIRRDTHMLLHKQKK